MLNFYIVKMFYCESDSKKFTSRGQPDME